MMMMLITIIIITLEPEKPFFNSFGPLAPKVAHQ
jgi:hypothetical protein